MFIAKRRSLRSPAPDDSRLAQGPAPVSWVVFLQPTPGMTPRRAAVTLLPGDSPRAAAGGRGGRRAGCPPRGARGAHPEVPGMPTRRCPLISYHPGMAAPRPPAPPAAAQPSPGAIPPGCAATTARDRTHGSSRDAYSHFSNRGKRSW